MVPRGCAVLYVPFHNHHRIRTTIPTSWGFVPQQLRADVPSHEYFVRLFERILTTDNTPNISVPAVLQFRKEVCGGEETIRSYCMTIAREGGKLLAQRLGTETLKVSAEQACCFTMVRLPLTLVRLGVTETQGPKFARWIQETTPEEYETYIPTKYYAGEFWVRISGQVYLEYEDFEKAATILRELCRRAEAMEWKSDNLES